MKLVISVDPVRFPLTGIGRYTYELAQRLQDHRDINELRFFADSTLTRTPIPPTSGQ